MVFSSCCGGGGGSVEVAHGLHREEAVCPWYIGVRRTRVGGVGEKGLLLLLGDWLWSVYKGQPSGLHLQQQQQQNCPARVWQVAVKELYHA